MTQAEVKALFGRGEKAEIPEEVKAAASRYLLARRRKEESEASLKKLSEQQRTAEDHLMKLLEQARIKTIAVDNVSLTMVQSDRYSITKADLDSSDFLLWLARAGGRDLLERSVNANAFSAFCRKLEDAEKPLHPRVKKVRLQKIRGTV